MKKTVFCIAIAAICCFSAKAQNVFPANGNVGIGTATPNGKLVINNANSFNGSESEFHRDHLVLSGRNPGNGGYFGSLTWNSAGRRRASIVAAMEHDDSDHVGLAFFTRGTDGPGKMYESMRISRNGNVGIGTKSPLGKLVINNLNPFNGSESEFHRDHLVLSGRNPGNGGYFGSLTWNSGGRRRASIVAAMEHDDSDHVGLAFFTRGTDGPGKMYESMRISRNGNVGIGTTKPQSLLAVNGTITSKEVKVTLEGWSDFVFEPGYDLPTLEEVEEHIKEHKHLPDVPNEAEVKENGLSLGESNAVLLQKIEELTLYLIEQNKKIKEQSEKFEKLEKENSELKKLNSRFLELEKKIEEHSKR